MKKSPLLFIPLVLLAIITVCYSLIIYASLPFLSIRYISLILIGGFAVRFFISRPNKLTLSNCIPIIICVIGVTTGISGAIFSNLMIIKLYPVIINTMMLTIFMYSLYQPPTIIERFEKIKDKNLPDEALPYIRIVTKSWCVFFIINGLIALYTVFFASFKTWALYNGLLSYLFMGVFFTAELLIRYFVKKRNNSFHNFFKWLEENPEKVIFEDENAVVKAAQFLNDIDILASKILTKTQHRWAICYNNSYHFCVGFFAILSCKKNPILLPNNLPSSVKSLASEYDAILSDIHNLDATDLPEEVKNKYKSGTIDTDINITFFTSGSTGSPKKIIRTLKQISMEISTLNSVFLSKIKNTTFYSTVSHQHLYGLTFYILWPLSNKNPITLKIINFSEQLDPIFKMHKKSTLITSPSFLQRIDSQSIKPEKLNIFSAGGHLSKPTILQTVKSLGVYPNDIFGSTETGVIAYKFTDKSHYWKPFPKIKVAKTANGCLVVKSPFSSKEDKLVTGDQIVFYKKQYFELLGRMDQVVKVEGKRISLTQIEQYLQKHNFIDDVCAIKMEDKRQYIAVIVKLNDKGVMALNKNSKNYINDQLRDFIATNIDRILLPRRFRYVSHIPINSQGKRIKSQLQELFE